MQERLPCRTVDPEVFFPLGTTSRADREQTKAAKEHCHTCPIEHQCLLYALAIGADHGIWGGTTEQERRWMRRNRHPLTIEGNTREDRPSLVRELAS